ncbi:MAG TPA: TadE/TadG family type IV pilus assembly protein [Trinickia sp.]|jgi:Flp pilus assembly protein TadG|uniref:TadE/TadG family type IV pilus assembly protein n=1 Tax=Trinickia sp. TaxID=2571163 RepID=UPI002CE424D5|nr:TadE/TadG family type IV pilus assembly protein [Trinickia sp.]HTI18087.1 TadE/TadG family type IV pilus assembly protein [Trinickia sp.]
MPHREKRYNVKRERGVALVELALVLTLLLTMLGGVVELGRAIYQYETLTKSARNAARFLSQYSPLDPDYPIAEAQCLAVFGNTECTGNTLAPGLQTTNVVVCDRNSSPGCPNETFSGYQVHDASDNNGSGQLEESINLVKVVITGYTYSPIQSLFSFTGVTFGDISVVMRQP